MTSVTNQHVTNTSKILVTEIEHLQTSVSALDAKVDALAHRMASMNGINNIVSKELSGQISHLIDQTNLVISAMNLTSNQIPDDSISKAIEHTNVLLHFMA